MLGIGLCTGMSDNMKSVIAPCPWVGNVERGSSAMPASGDMHIVSAAMELSGDVVSNRGCLMASVNAAGSVSTYANRAAWSVWGLA